jgi:hypothetical protein
MVNRNSTTPTTPVASRVMVFPGSSMFLKMKGLCDVSTCLGELGGDARVIVDGVDTVPLLEDHDHALTGQ